MRSFRLSLTAVAVGAIVACALPATSVAAPTPAVSAPTKQLTAQWWQTMVSLPATDRASRCNLGTRNIVFLGATATGTVSGSCTLSAGTSVLLPLINVECSSIEEGTDFFGATPRERLLCAKGIADSFTDLVLTINGVEIGNLSRLRVASPPFMFSPVEGNELVPPGTGGSASDGYWALIGPLAPGDYDVFASGAVPGVFATSITYHLHVV